MVGLIWWRTDRQPAPELEGAASAPVPAVVPTANERLVVALTPTVAPAEGRPEVVVESTPEPEAQPRRETKRRAKPRSKPKDEQPERPVFRRFD